MNLLYLPTLIGLALKYGPEALALFNVAKQYMPLAEALFNAIAPLLPHGKARVAEIASRFGMSPRTLARRLEAEGLTFAGVLIELRADLARRYLQDEDLPVSEIAWLLGYREVSTFTHAFKRWTGKTPRQARSQGNGAWPASGPR